MRRIALIAESQTRSDVPKKAYDFYQSPKSRWMNSIIEYMEARDFVWDNIFFISTVNMKLYGANEIIYPYEKSKYHPRKKECAKLAKDILVYLLTFDEPLFVELHMSQTLANELKPLFALHDIPYKFYAEGQSLAAKPLYYQRLIQEQLEIKKVRMIYREKWALAAGIIKRSPTEGQRILDEYGHKLYLFSPLVETALEELRYSLKKYYERVTAESTSFEEFHQSLLSEEDTEEFEEFFQDIELLSGLFNNPERYEKLMSKFGHTMAKFERYLIKREYVIEMESKISAILLKLQIALMKK